MSEPAGVVTIYELWLTYNQSCGELLDLGDLARLGRGEACEG